jgi:hypothetical protein
LRAQKSKKEKVEVKREGGGEQLFKALDASDDEEEGDDTHAAGSGGFIDDTGVAAAHRDLRDDVSVEASEAEEDDGENLDALFETKSARRKKSQVNFFASGPCSLAGLNRCFQPTACRQWLRPFLSSLCGGDSLRNCAPPLELQASGGVVLRAVEVGRVRGKLHP